MQPTDAYNVTRRPLDVEDYIDILRRHKGWIFGPFLFTLVASVVGAYMWPDGYVSEAVVKIVPQQIPENMVHPAMTQTILDQISSLEQSVRSRAVLTKIINDYGLYPRERSRMTMEDVIELMNKAIEIHPVEAEGASGGPGHIVPAFVVKFTYEDRLKAQRVVSDLVTKFIDENFHNQSNVTFQTEQFMKDKLAQAQKDLDAAESKLQEFRAKNNGRLPDQLDANMRELQAAQTHLDFLATSVSRAQQDKLQMEGLIRIYKDQLAALAKEPQDQAAMAQKDEKLADIDREIKIWEDRVIAYLQMYRETYPDVVTAKKNLEAARKKREDLLKEEAEAKSDAETKKADAPPAPARVSPLIAKETRDLNAQIQHTESSIQAKELEIQELNSEVKRATETVKIYEARVETVPLGDKEYADLLRDRDLAKAAYVELDQKLQQAQVAKDMEDRSEGERLELLDSASLPESPATPKRYIVIPAGAGIGLLLGLVIAGAREMKDSSLKNLKDVRAYTQMAILGSIPLLENDFVVRRRKRLAWLGWTTACMVSVIVMVGSVVYYEVTKT